MKQLATIGAVVAMLLIAALVMGNREKEGIEPDPVPVTKVATPVDLPQVPTTKADLNGTLSLKARLSNGYVLAGQSKEIYATFDTSAIDYQGAKRPALNVALVVDRSGSMSGEKFDQVKEAALRMVDRLEEGDRIALVSYGTDVTVDFPSAEINETNRIRLRSAIQRMAEGGGTNLSGGFQSGYSEVSRWKNSDFVNRVILMSDGHANVGMTSSSALTRLTRTSLENEISVTTVGVGLDYNEDLMTEMANTGAGNYYFIDDAKRIVSIFEEELRGLASTVARDAALLITLAPGVESAGVFGLNFKEESGKVIVPLAEFRSAETKSLLMKVRVSELLPEGTSPVLNVALSYQDVIHDKPVSGLLELKVATTSDATKAAEVVDPSVVARVQQIEIANSMQEAMELYGSGKAEEAKVRIEQAQRTVRVTRKKVALPNDARYEKADQDLEALKATIDSVPASSAEGRTTIKKAKARGNSINRSVDLF